MDCQKQSNGNASWGVLYTALIGFGRLCRSLSLRVNYILTLTWGFQRCSFRQSGQCEGLNKWNEWQKWLHVFFIVYNNIIHNHFWYEAAKFILQNIMSEESSNKLFKDPFSFKGRIRRLEYLYSIICINIAGFILQFYSVIQEKCTGSFIFDIILLIFLCWFAYAQGCKRCHDIGLSGWYQIIPFFFIVLLFKEGNFDTNKYGTNPKW